MREREGVDAADGVDTLLVYLLAEIDDEVRLASFADGPQQVTPDVVAGLLQRKGKSDTLAQLYAGTGQAAAGLALWKVSSLSECLFSLLLCCLVCRFCDMLASQLLVCLDSCPLL